jgi:hypothetical protein
VIHLVCDGDPGAQARVGRRRPGLPSPLPTVPSEVRPPFGLLYHYYPRHHRTPIKSVGDGSDIVALELGLDGGDLEDLCVVV